MQTLVLKHANKNRLGAVEWGPNDFDVSRTKIVAVSVEYFCRFRRQKGGRGFDDHRTLVPALDR